MTNRFDFKIRFIGPSTEKYTIDAKDLARSIEGWNDALTSVSAYSLDRMECNLRIHANFKPGSFIVDFTLLAVPLGSLSMGEIRNAYELFKMVLDLIKLYREFRGKPIPEPTKDELISGTYSPVIINNYGKVNVKNAIFNAYSNPQVRKALANVSTFSRKSEENYIEVTGDGGVEEVITHDDAKIFAQAEQQELNKIKIEIQKPCLNGRGKWGFKFMGESFSAYIKDTDFLELVANGEITFGSGDLLEVDTLLTLNNGTKRTWSILKVHKIIPRHRKPTLF